MGTEEDWGRLPYATQILIDARAACSASMEAFLRYPIGTKKSRATKGKLMTSTTRYSRRHDWAEQRAAVWTWMYRNSRLSLPEIAAATNCPTHATVHAAIRRHEKA